MSERYKLLGAFWDGKPSVLAAMPQFFTEDEIGYCEDYVTEFNLFDTPYMQRKIRFSEILEEISYCEFEAIMDKVKGCDKIFLQIDYLPYNLSPIVAKFFVKRLIQVYNVIVELNARAEVSIVAAADISSKIIPYMSEYVMDTESTHHSN